MKVIIAEKPSLGRAIAEVLPGQKVNQKTHITCGSDYIVTWCFGHLLELKMPDGYNPEYKNWSARPIPFIPERWERVVVNDKAAQVSAIRKILQTASVVVNAGDPDREGAMLVDSLISFLSWNRPVWRLLVSDVNPKAVRRAIEKMDQHNSTKDMSTSADARAKADWLYGINLTTAYTLAARSQGFDGTLNIGRVQTPVLGLLVKRKKERDNFSSHPFYSVVAELEKGGKFKAKAEITAAESFFDTDGRLIERSIADQVVSGSKEQKATATLIEKEKSVSNAPSLYSLADLQKDANKLLGLTATQTLAAAQDLYQSGATTYPRTDCNYITDDLWGDGKNTLPSLARQFPAAAIANADIKHSCVNNSKVGAHHAIIPTDNIPDLAKMKASERSVYELIVQRYISIFYPPATDEKTKITITIGANNFIAKGVIETSRGWRDVVGAKAPDNALPAIAQGDDLAVLSLEVETSMTTPPDEYTEASLLSAMTNIAKHVTNPDLKGILKETDGLGTEATRASIIEGLVTREYAERQKKKIVPTAKGVQFIEQLPSEITEPDLTARWELELGCIAEGKGSRENFLDQIAQDVERLAKNPSIAITAKTGITCHACNTGTLKRRARNEGGFFWICTEKACGFSCNDNKGKPAESTLYKCPVCSERLSRRIGKDGGWWWSCTGFKVSGCKYSADDQRGKPVEREAKPKVPEIDTTEKKDCPDCGKPMKLRPGKFGDFWGCTGYPNCKKTVKAE